MSKLNLVTIKCKLFLEESKGNLNIKLNNITTIESGEEIIDNKNFGIYKSLPNLNHLIFSSTYLPLNNNYLFEIFNERIKRSDINIHSNLKN